MNAFGIPAFDEPTHALFVSLLVKSVLILLPALGIHLLFRRVSASAKSHLWTVAIIALLLAPLLSLILPAWRPPVEQWFGFPANSEPAQWEVRYLNPEDASRLLAEGADETSVLSQAVENPASVEAPRDSSNWKRFVKPDVLIANLAKVWIAGVVLLLSALLVSIFRVMRLNRASAEIQDGEWLELLQRIREELGVECNVRLVLAPSSTIPMTWDLFNAVVFLPPESSGWTREKRVAVLRHELAHVRRRDCPVQLLAGVVSAIYWMNPLVWLAARALRLEQEKACDDLVLTSGSEAENYAGQLVQIAREFRPAPAARFTAITMARRSQLEKRLKAILDRKRRRRPIGWRTQTGLFIGVCLAAAAIATVDLSAQGQSATQSSETLADKSSEQAADDPIDANVEKQNSESLDTQIDPTDLNPESGTSGKRAIYDKLNNIVIPEVLFDSVPLSEVVGYLIDESRNRDPEGKGINFMIHPFVYDAGLTTAQPTEEVYLPNVMIRINPALTDVRLADVLDAVVKVAGQPIKFSVEEDAVVFSPKLPEPRELITRTYRVNPHIFPQRLEAAYRKLLEEGNYNQDEANNRIKKLNASNQRMPLNDSLQIENDSGVSYLSVTNEALAMHVTLRDFFDALGISVLPPNALFYKDRIGLLLVRASSQELDIVEKALVDLNAPPPQVNLQVKLFELSGETFEKLGIDRFLPDSTTNQINANSDSKSSGHSITTYRLINGKKITESHSNGSKFQDNTQTVHINGKKGLLTAAQFKILAHALEQDEQVKLVDSEQVTTTSGREVRVEFKRNSTTITAPESGKPVGGGAGIASKGAESISNRGGNQGHSGPYLLIKPNVTVNGHTVELIISMFSFETLGYATPQEFSTQTESQIEETAPRTIQSQFPVPGVKSRLFSTTGTIWDGQTLAVGRMRFTESSDDEGELLILMTPTIIDPAGNRVNDPDNLPFDPNTVPPKKPNPWNRYLNPAGH